jgi:hypothetical protein
MLLAYLVQAPHSLLKAGLSTPMIYCKPSKQRGETALQAELSIECWSYASTTTTSFGEDHTTTSSLSIK